MSEPLMSFTSHVDGRNAHVDLFEDRLEWTRTGSAAARWTKASLTMGASLLAGRKRETETVPVRAITNVSTKRDGLLNTVVNVATASGTVSFRVSHSEAEQIRSTLMGLLASK